MRTLNVNQMETLTGGQDREQQGWTSPGCVDAMIGLGVAVASSFAGPAGIISGLAGFASFVNHVGDCE